jgi:thiamine-monophosphate kinase
MMLQCLILKTKKSLFQDILVEGVHFDLAYMPLKHLGYKAVTTNISDICAMNQRLHKLLFPLPFSFSFRSIR